MNLEELSQKKWYVEHFDGCPAFTEMTAHGFTNKTLTADIPVYRMNIAYYSRGQGDWMSLHSDHQKIGEAIVKLFLRDKNVVLDLHKKWLVSFDLMMRNFYQRRTDDLVRLNDEHLLAWAEDVHKFYRQVSMPGFIDGYMFYADKRFDFLIRDFCRKNNIKNHPKIYSTLSAPIDSSFINEEESDLYGIVLKLKKGGFHRKGDLQKFLSKPAHAKLAALIGLHLVKYAWIKSSYAGYREYDLRAVEEETARMFESRSHRNIFNRHKAEKEKLFLKYKFSAEIKAIAKLTEIFVKWQDQRKIYTLTFVTLQSKILKEISRRKHLDYDLLKFSCSKEMRSILSLKYDLSKLKKRREASLFLYENGGIRERAVGKSAIQFLEKVSQADVENVEEFSGIVASIGKASGKVRVVMTAANIHQVEKGEILVAPMTRPEHLAGMKKAAAIVTDDGGITCHAAIVSRELKIPCIIGTKIATKVLHDGDIVEVDADRGMVKILKK